MSRSRLALGFVVVSLLPAVVTSVARADVTLKGPADAIELTATGATVGEVLQRLSSTYGLQVHGGEGITEPFSGTYQGDLRTVVDQILATRNHFMRQSGSELALFIAQPAPDTKSVSTTTTPLQDATVGGDPVKQSLENKTPTMSLEAQQLAVKMFGEKGRYLQVDESLLRSFANGRGGRRFKQPPPP